MKVRVVGAGVMGLVAAYTLARRGAKVALYERQPDIGPATCSWWAGGMIAPWCERESAEEAVITHGREAFAFWREVAPDYTENGSLVVAPPRDMRELERFGRRTREYEQRDAEGVAALEPDLAGRFRRGLFFAREAHLTPRKALQALKHRLAEMGAELHFATDGLADPAPDERIVDCTGLRARAELAGLRGVRGEMLHLRCRGFSLSRPVRLLHPRFPLYIVPRGEGVFMVGATMIESDTRGPATARSLVELLNAAYALHPAFAEAEILEMGADVRPAFADNLPRVVEAGGRLYLNGAYRHGFLLSPAIARAAADLILEDRRDPQLVTSQLAPA